MYYLKNIKASTSCVTFIRRVYSNLYAAIEYHILQKKLQELWYLEENIFFILLKLIKF